MKSWWEIGGKSVPGTTRGQIRLLSIPGGQFCLNIFFCVFEGFGMMVVDGEIFLGVPVLV